MILTLFYRQNYELIGIDQSAYLIYFFCLGRYLNWLYPCFGELWRLRLLKPLLYKDFREGAFESLKVMSAKPFRRF